MKKVFLLPILATVLLGSMNSSHAFIAADEFSFDEDHSGINSGYTFKENYNCTARVGDTGLFSFRTFVYSYSYTPLSFNDWYYMEGASSEGARPVKYTNVSELKVLHIPSWEAFFAKTRAPWLESCRKSRFCDGPDWDAERWFPTPNNTFEAIQKEYWNGLLAKSPELTDEQLAYHSRFLSKQGSVGKEIALTRFLIGPVTSDDIARQSTLFIYEKNVLGLNSRTDLGERMSAFKKAKRKPAYRLVIDHRNPSQSYFESYSKKKKASSDRIPLNCTEIGTLERESERR